MKFCDKFGWGLECVASNSVLLSWVDYGSQSLKHPEQSLEMGSFRCPGCNLNPSYQTDKLDYGFEKCMLQRLASMLI